MNIYKGYLTTLFLIVITVIVIDSTFYYSLFARLCRFARQRTIHYSLLPTRPSSAQSSSFATLLAYFATLKSLSTFMGLRFGR